MTDYEFKKFMESNPIKDLHDITTALRTLAGYAGGGHLTPQQTESALRTFAKQSDDVIMKTRVNIGTFNAIMNENFGVNSQAVETYLKYRMECIVDETKR